MPLSLPIIGHLLPPNPLEAVLRAAFEATGAEIELERWERRPHQLADTVATLRDERFAGALISSPHKEKAAPLSDALSEDARAAGAINLYVRDEHRLRGHNTDVDGIRAGLSAILPSVQGKWPRQAIVLGAGGGARAAVGFLIGAGFQHVVVFNRHLHRAEALVAHFARSARHMELRARPWHDAIIEAELARSPVIVNASGVGSRSGESPIPAELLPSERYLLDLVLVRTTDLMRAVKERDGTVANGRVSFLTGAATTVRLLTGTEPPADVLKAALAAELEPGGDETPVVGD